MDGHRFDELTKTLSAGISRRRIVRGVTAGMTSAVLAAIGRGQTEAAPNRCAQGCAFEPKGPRQAACKQACKQCDGDFSRICFGIEIICCPPDSFCCQGPTGVTCCPFGSECCGDQCCDEGTFCCFAADPQCVAPCPEGTFLNPETCACDPLVFCEPGVPAENCFAGVFSDCGPEEGTCGLVDNADGEGCDCIERICTGIPCVTDADCESGLCVTIPGCCFETTFCAIPCGAEPVGAEAAGSRWGP